MVHESLGGAQVFGWCTSLWVVHESLGGAQVFGWCMGFIVLKACLRRLALSTRLRLELTMLAFVFALIFIPRLYATIVFIY